jgi:hypothetical protein
VMKMRLAIMRLQPSCRLRRSPARTK